MTANYVIAGASGFVGTALTEALESAGHTVYRLVRSKSRSALEIEWDPNNQRLDATRLPEHPVCINLSGENVAAGRWTEKKKRAIIDSRVNATTTLVQALLQLELPATQLVSASAIGIYGDRGDDRLTEQSHEGTGFLAETCIHWEQATQALSNAGVPVATARFGIILDPKGGALQKMLPAFRLGVGGKIGSGNQWMSWISLADTIGAILHIIDQTLAGPINITAPEPVQNSSFTKELGSVLCRPTVLPLPAFAARLVLGQFADEALLASARAIPTVLTESNYSFKHPTLREALTAML